MDKGNKLILLSVFILIYALLSVISFIEYKINKDNETNDEKVNLKLLYLLPWGFSSLGAIIAQISLKYTKKYLIINNACAFLTQMALLAIYIIFA